MPVTPTKFQFNTVIVLFGLGVAAIGLHDIKERHLAKLPRSKVGGRELVRQLHGDVDVSRHSSRRKVEQQQAAETRDKEWNSVQRYLGSLVP